MTFCRLLKSGRGKMWSFKYEYVLGSIIVYGVIKASNAFTSYMSKMHDATDAVTKDVVKDTKQELETLARELTAMRQDLGRLRSKLTTRTNGNAM